MELKDKKIGFAITGSFCNFKETKGVLEEIKKEGVKEIIPIVSYSTKDFDTRFYKAEEYIKMVEDTTNNKVIDTIVKAEPIGPKNMVDLIRVFIPYIVLIILFIINIFFRQYSVTRNVFYNLTCCIVFATIILLAFRARFDESMILILKTDYHTNFDFFSDMLAFVNVMIYGLCIADVFLALSEARFSFGRKPKKVEKTKNVKNKQTKKEKKPSAVQIEDEETL